MLGLIINDPVESPSAALLPRDTAPGARLIVSPCAPRRRRPVVVVQSMYHFECLVKTTNGPS